MPCADLEGWTGLEPDLGKAHADLMGLIFRSRQQHHLCLIPVPQPYHHHEIGAADSRAGIARSAAAMCCHFLL
jgi:hypothetical protein